MDAEGLCSDSIPGHIPSMAASGARGSAEVEGGFAVSDEGCELELVLRLHGTW